MPNTREHTWGDRLVVEAFHYPGGLQRAVKQIHHVVGPYVGVRNTFARLLRIERPADLDDRDRFRAWLLVVAFGGDPEDWGIGDDVVPAAFDPTVLRSALSPATLSDGALTGSSARSSTDRASDYGSVVAHSAAISFLRDAA